MTVVGTKEILGQEYEIDVDRYGKFRIMETGEADEKSIILGSGETLDVATTKARTELNRRKVKVSVPFITKTGERGVATGFHGRNRTVLTEREDGSRTPFDGYKAFKPEMPQVTLDRYLEIKDEISKLQVERNMIDKQWEFDLAARVKHAIEEAHKAKEKPLARRRKQRA